MSEGKYNATAPTAPDKGFLPLQIDVNGSLKTVGAATDVLVGAVTETAPTTDTASSGLNGRLQRIAQRLTSLIALQPAAQVIAIPANAATYSATGIAYTAYATPTDLIGIRGSATKTIVVLRLSTYIQATAAGVVTLDYVKRTTANTGGTGASGGTPVLRDSAQGAATATIDVYTAAPTTGTGAVLNSLVGVSSVLTGSPQLFDIGGFGTASTASGSPIQNGDIRRPVVLRGVIEALYSNYRGAALPAGTSMSYLVEWIEF